MLLLLRFLAAVLALALPGGLASVRVWQATVNLPTHVEGAPDENPPFDVFRTGNYFYPYTVRTNFTKKVVDHAWRTLNLENEYLVCTVLPDLGGRLYTCLDKLSGRDMFYRNPSVKKADIALRGSWVAFGMEMSFPVAHSWVTVSPVDFATTESPDGSASVWVANIDRVDGMQWRVEFVLHPGSTVLEQRVTLYNRDSVRHRYAWWANAGIQVEDKSTRFIYPMRLASVHGQHRAVEWPRVDHGKDLSVVGNEHGPGMGFFALGSREPFMAVYHPHSRSGTVHYARPDEAPGKKLWYWADQDRRIRRELSDNNSAYVEMQAGAFQNQTLFGFLAPQQTRQFTEYWMPVRNLDGISRANLAGVLNLTRAAQPDGRVALTAEFAANHALSGASIRVLDGEREVFREKADLSVPVTYSHTVRDLPASPRYTFELADASGTVLMRHIEGQYDDAPPPGVEPGPLPERDFKNLQNPEDHVRAGTYNELQGNLGWQSRFAYHNDRSGLERFPGDADLLKSLGRLDVTLGRYDEGVEYLSQARAKAPSDPEIDYLLGVAFAGLGQDEKARAAWQPIRHDPSFGSAVSLELGCLWARQGNLKRALDLLRAAYSGDPNLLRAGEAEVAVLRRLGESRAAAERLRHWLALDPTDSFLRNEGVALGGKDATLEPHLAADPERVLNLAVEYIDLGSFQDALELLERRYPAVDPLEAEPGAVLPQQYPLVAYYRGYCRERLGGSGAKDYQAASAESTLYVFPSRPSEFAVLQAALRQNPGDGAAHDLLGSLDLWARRVDEAVEEWRKARALRPDLPALDRNLSRTLFSLKGDRKPGMKTLHQGRKLDRAKAQLEKDRVRLCN
ncbi:MAG TPA: DUF5107 domain-containing protein [Terriglobia bacterium]|nr:DUF5107 domain-containing protein [Terriglobia bacterium]